MRFFNRDFVGAWLHGAGRDPVEGEGVTIDLMASCPHAGMGCP